MPRDPGEREAPPSRANVCLDTPAIVPSVSYRLPRESLVSRSRIYNSVAFPNIQDPRGTAGAGQIRESVEARLQVAPAPLGGGLGAEPGGRADRRERLPLGRLAETSLSFTRSGPHAHRDLILARRPDTVSLTLGHGAPPASGLVPPCYHIMSCFVKVATRPPELLEAVWINNPEREAESEVVRQ